MDKRTKKQSISVLLIEVVVYAVIMGLYVYLGLRYLSEPMYKLFNSNLNWYSVAVILLILAQAVLLEYIVSFLLGSLGIFRLKE
jgi:hypothetical protein